MAAPDGHPTMLLVLTNSQDATADYLVPILASRGLSVMRWDTDTLIPRSTFTYTTAGGPALRFDGRWASPEEVAHIWYRRPERLRSKSLGTTPEGECAIDEWTETVEGFLAHVPMPRWVNHPSANAAASSKIRQLSDAAALGLSVPETLVTQDEAALREFFGQHGAVIVKPLGRGYIERPDGSDSLIYTNSVDQAELADLTELAACPTLFQRRVDKVADVRITVLDGQWHAVQLLAVESDGRQRCDIRRDNMEDVAYRPIDLPAEIQSRLQQLMLRYHLRFAAIDMVIERDGRWLFLEVNPNGQWAWLDIVAGMHIADAFVESFSDA